MNNRIVKKSALCFSILLFILWFALGTTSTITWFQEEDTIVNALHFGNIDIDMYYKTSGSYSEIDSTTEVFGGDDLYEPGFTKVVYLRIDNSGSIPFTFDLSIVPQLGSTIIGTNVLGGSIDLADYLKFGLVTGDTEQEVLDKTADRVSARALADTALSQYSESGGSLAAGESSYAALIVYLPEEVGNEANYRGDEAPQVGLGISAIANQQ